MSVHRELSAPNAMRIRDIVWLLVAALVATAVIRMIPATSLPAPMLALVHSDRPAPCAPIRVAVNPSGASPSSLEMLTDAMERWSATGLVSFIQVGDTDLIPQTGDVGHWQIAGDPDVVIAFANPRSSDLFASGLHAEHLSTDAWVVAGAAETGVTAAHRPAASVVFATDWMASAQSGYGPGTMGAAFLHELGHAAGLGHNLSRDSVMFGAIDAGSGVITTADIASLEALVVSCAS